MKEIIVNHKAQIVENVKAAETLLPLFVLFASLNITFGWPDEIWKVNISVRFGLWVLVIVQLLDGQCCLHTSASRKQLKWHPPPVQFCWHCIPLHNKEQFPELHSCRQDGESQTVWQPPWGHRYGNETARLLLKKSCVLVETRGSPNLLLLVLIIGAAQSFLKYILTVLTYLFLSSLWKDDWAFRLNMSAVCPIARGCAPQHKWIFRQLLWNWYQK